MKCIAGNRIAQQSMNVVTSWRLSSTMKRPPAIQRGWQCRISMSELESWSWKQREVLVVADIPVR